MKHSSKKTIVALSLFAFTFMTSWVPAANAVVLDTTSAQQARTAQSTDEQVINDFLSSRLVQAKLVDLGVNPELAKERVASLTPAERELLSQKINELPAGAGAVEVIGIVFIVLLILELLGVTDVFKRI